MKRYETRILVVDDDPEILEGTARLLKNAGYTVDIADCGKKTLQLLDENQPDLLLLDRELPDIDGLEVCRQIKQNPAYSNVFVVLISGFYTESAEQSKGLEAGADGYITRPITNRELLARVESETRILGLYRVLRVKVGELEQLYKATSDQNAATLNLLEDAVSAKNQLEKSDSLLREMGRVAKIGGWEFNIETGEQTWTEEVYRIHEVDMTFDPNVSKGLDFYAPASRPIIEGAVRRAIEQGEPFDLELEFITARGNLRWVHAVGMANREAGMVRGTIQDITERKQAEDARNASEVRYRRLFEASRDGILILDAETGMIVDVNPLLVELLGYSHEAFLGKKVWELGFFKDLFANEANFVELQQHEYIRYENMALETSDGRRIDVEFVSNVYLVNRGKVIQCNIRDISDRKRLQASLDIERTLLKTLVSTLPVAVYLKDSRGRKTLTNPVDMRNMGANSEKEILGKTDFDLFTPEVATALQKSDQSVLSGTPLLNHEEKITKPDGSTIWLLTSKVPLLDTAGCVIGLAGISLDITEQKRVTDTNLQLAMAVEQTAESIVITDIEGTILYVNPAFEKTSGYSKEEAVGRNPRIVTSGKQNQEFYRQMWDTLHRGELWQGHMINKRKNGKFYEEEATISPILDNSGKIINYVAVKRDVTQEMQIEAQLRQAQKMEGIGQLAGGVAHDFNNILAVISMQASLLGDATNLTQEQRELTQELEDAVQRGADLTRQLHIFSQRQTMQPRDIDLNDVVTNIGKMLQRILGEDIRMEFKFSPQPSFVHADPGMMDQVLMNLTVNARHAMPEGGRLIFEISAVEFDELAASQSPKSRPGSFVRLSVSDTGCGIAPENLDRIFEPFFTTKEVGKGTGLGLSTVFGIAKQHEGWINVYSEVGHGTTFRVYFPRLAKNEEKESAKQIEAAVIGGKETILLVEDDPSLRSLVKTALSHLGYHVLEASTGVAALQVWKQSRDEISLLLTDLVMPDGMNGKELARHLLEDKPHLKVIYASGYSSEVAGKDLTVVDGVNFLSKPYKARKLAHTVRAMLDT